MRVHIYIYRYKHMHLNLYLFVYLYVYVYAYECMYIYICICNICIFMSDCIHIYIYLEAMSNGRMSSWPCLDEGYRALKSTVYFHHMLLVTATSPMAHHSFHPKRANSRIGVFRLFGTALNQKRAICTSKRIWNSRNCASCDTRLPWLSFRTCCSSMRG